LCSIFDGASRALGHCHIRERMTEPEVECILQRTREIHPGVTLRIISDNRPQFIAKDFKEFIRIARLTPVQTSPYFAHSNGKAERFHETIKSDEVRHAFAGTLDAGSHRHTSHALTQRVRGHSYAKGQRSFPPF
jgi:putative transposase